MRHWALSAIGLCLAACGQPPTGGPANDALAPPAQVAPSASAGPPAAPIVAPLRPSGDALADFRGDLAARGTEPFWSVQVYAGKRLILTTPETQVADTPAPERPYRAPIQANGGVVLLASKDLTLALRAAACSDGMSDIAYPWEAVLTVGAEAPRKGCAYPRWSNDLVNLIGAIDACHAKLGAKNKPPVLWAARDTAGATVRLRNATGRGRIDCRVTPSGEATLTPLGENAPQLASEEDLIFYRAPAPNPGGECYEADKAKGPKGEDLGWLDTNEGC